jgi:DNA-binding response OmpR family regulator
MLPRKDGFEICRELRRRGSKTPIIMLTAKSQDAEKVLGLEWGADDYVTKPFSPSELRARVNAVTRRTHSESDGVVRFGDAALDLERCELRVKGSPVALTALEYKLLAVLAANRGRTLSRDRLLDLVWGHDAAVTGRVVDNHVVTLRKKIEPGESTPKYLVSVRGLGYRFDVDQTQS